MHVESCNHVDHTNNSRPRPYVTGQIGRDRSPPTEQEVSWTDEECESDESESDVTSCSGKPRNEQAVLIPVKISGLVSSVVHRSTRALWLWLALVSICLVMCL